MKQKNISQKGKLIVYGHLMAIFSIFVWGTTFITTKTLLPNFTPLEILFYRFLIGYLTLIFISFKPLPFRRFKTEALLFLAGASGVTIYFLFENIALSYTYATNVSIIVSTAPIFTGIFAMIFTKQKLSQTFFVGFFIAILGIGLVTFGSGEGIHLNPTGDLLALGGAISWGIYSVATTMASPSSNESLAVTRRIFFYGILSMIPLMFWQKTSLSILTVHDKDSILKLLFLGIVASAFCYITFNRAMQILGAIRTSVYIYLIPVVTLIFSYFLLDEKLTIYSGAGCGLVLLGLFLSERKKTH